MSRRQRVTRDFRLRDSTRVVCRQPRKIRYFDPSHPEHINRISAPIPNARDIDSGLLNQGTPANLDRTAHIRNALRMELPNLLPGHPRHYG